MDTKAREKENALLMGALKTEVSASTPLVSAGEEFSIFVVIRNPFPVEVTIYSVETHIPVVLRDEYQRSIHRRNVLARRSQLIKNASKESLWKSFLIYPGFWAQDFSNLFMPYSGPRIARAVVQEPEEEPVLFDGLRIDTQGGTYVEGDVTVTDGNFITRDQIQIHIENIDGYSEDQLRELLWRVNEYVRGKPQTLQPGDSLVMHFILKAPHWLTFTPLAHTFQIQVRYILNNQLHLDTVPYSLNIRAPMMSSLIGAIIGSILGAIIHNQGIPSDPASALRLFLISAIFAFVIILAFARKNNVQQIISIEDFWGGIFIGFIVGYSGESFVQSIIGAIK